MMDWTKMLKDDKLKTGYKYVANLAQRIAYNLGNTASQTEVKIISCIPIDVTDLYKKIYKLEKELGKAIHEKKLVEKADNIHFNTHLLSKRPKLQEYNYHESSSKCPEIPVSVSYGDPVVVVSRGNNHKMCRETPTKFIKPPFYKSIESFYKESGKDFHGDRLRKNAKKATSDGRGHVVNSDFCYLKPVQYYHAEPTALEYRLLIPSSDYQSFEMIDNKTQNKCLDSCSRQPTHEEIAAEHYLEPIAECCPLDATMAFHRIESFTKLQSHYKSGETLLNDPSLVYRHGKPAPEVRNLTTAYDWYSTDSTTRLQQTEKTREHGYEISRPTPNTRSAKNIFITECVNPQNIPQQSQQESISESQQIEATFKSLGLPNTEPKREKVTKHYISQGTQQTIPKHHGGELSPTLSCNQETQVPTIDSCSCCFFKQLTAEQLLNMPRSPLRKYLHDYEQTPSSSETCADYDYLCGQEGKERRRRNAFKIKRNEHFNITKKRQGKTTNSILEGIVTKYAHSTMQSSSSQYSAPVCRDEDSGSCSCCTGVFCDIDRVRRDHLVNSSNSSNQQYYDDTLYDLVPVKENKRTKNEVEKCRKRNDVIVNYTVQQNKLNKKTKPVDKSNNFNHMQTSRQNKIPRSNYTVRKNQTKLKQRTTIGKMETLSEPKSIDMECQTELSKYIAENQCTQPPEKHDDALSQIKQTLQFVLDRFRPHTHRDPSRKDAVMQVEGCQCNCNHRIPYNEPFMLNQANPRFIHCNPQITPAPFVYPTMPILTSPWINDGAMFVQPKRRSHRQPNSQVKYKSRFGVGRSIVPERKSPIPERRELIGDGKAETLSFKDVNCNKELDRPVLIKKFADVCEQAGEQTNLPTNDMKPQGLIHTIIFSSTNITKKCKNKKIYCCLSKQHSSKNVKKLDLECNNELNQESGPKNPKYTGSTVQEVIAELNEMEEYITRSEYKIGDVASSKGSVEKSKKKFTDMFRNIKNVFKTRSKNKTIDKRMSCDNVSTVEAQGFCVSSVHLLFPTKQNRTNTTNLLVSERYSFTDLHSKKCREAVLSKRKRRSRQIKL